MMQTQWPGLGPNLDFSSLDASAGTGKQIWPGEGALRASPAPPSAAADGVARPWWTCGTGSANGGDPLGALLGGAGSLGSLGGLGAGAGGIAGLGGGLAGLVSGLIGLLQQLAGALANGGNSGGGSGCAGGGSPLPAGPQQTFADADVSSTGDPHLAVTGTREGRGGSTAVDQHWDSMTAHDDLVHANQIAGGYRVSTAVTQPDANGVTFNTSATVHANFGQDAITMHRDGSYGIYDDGELRELGNGESVTLSGGETVTMNQDGSLLVNAKDAAGGTIVTTLRSTGNGVDVITHAHELALGGDAVAHAHRKPRYTPVVQAAESPAAAPAPAAAAVQN